MINKRLVAIGLAGILALAACGSDDEGSDDAAGDGGTEETTALRLWLNWRGRPRRGGRLARGAVRGRPPRRRPAVRASAVGRIVERLTTALPSNDSPDVIELGNTQAQTFEAAGALVDLTDSVTASAVIVSEPRGVQPTTAVLRRALLRRRPDRRVPHRLAGRRWPRGPPPSTSPLDDCGRSGQRRAPNFSHLPPRNWHARLVRGTPAATCCRTVTSGSASSDSPESIEGLSVVQRIMTEANAAPAGGDDANDYLAFCNEASACSWAPAEGQPDRGRVPRDGSQHQRVRPPRLERPGRRSCSSAVPTWPSRNSQNPELAIDLPELMVRSSSSTWRLGLLPARASLLEQVGGPGRRGPGDRRSQQPVPVPASENWASVEGEHPPDLAPPSPRRDIATEASRPTPHRGDAEPVISVLPSLGRNRPRPAPTLCRGGARRRRLPGRRRQPPCRRPVSPATAVMVVILGYLLVRLGVLSTQEFGPRPAVRHPAEVGGPGQLPRDPGRPLLLGGPAPTLVFCAVNVVLTPTIGTGIALLLGRSARGWTVLSVSLLLAWAMPALTTTVVWQWLFDTQYGLVNRLLTASAPTTRATAGWSSRCRSSSSPRSSW